MGNSNVSAEKKNTNSENLQFSGEVDDGLKYYNKMMENWMSANGYSGNLIEGDDTYYYYKMKEILEAYPNKGPPFAPSRICHHIYMGSLRNAEDLSLLKRLGITHVLNMTGTRRFDLTKSPYPKDSGIKEFLMIPAEDHDHYDMQQHFNRTFAFLDDCKSRKGKALVHCNLGVNRCGCIVAAYMMADAKMKLLGICSLLKVKRSVVLCNKNFRRQLILYARTHGHLDPITMEDLENVAQQKKLMREVAHPPEINEYAVDTRSRREPHVEAPKQAKLEELPPEGVSYSFRRSRQDVRNAQKGYREYVPSMSMARPLRVSLATGPISPSRLMETRKEDDTISTHSLHTIAIHTPTVYPSVSGQMKINGGLSRSSRPHSLYGSTRYLDPNDTAYHTLPRALSAGYGTPRGKDSPGSARSYSSPRSPSNRAAMSYPTSPISSSPSTASRHIPASSLDGLYLYKPRPAERSSDWRKSAKF